jgi:hypothetical protein
MKTKGRIPGMSGRRLPYLALACLLVLLSACKATNDAGPAAKQLSTVATNLAAYYDDLATQLDDTVRLNELQTILYSIPFGDADRARILDTKTEIAKRSTMAHSLAEVATAYSNLSGATAGADACTAASALADQLATAKAIPDGTGIPDVAGQASKELINFAQTRSVKAGSEGVAKAVSVVSEIFDGETKAYERIENQRLALAAMIARKIVEDHDIQIDFSTMVEPATKPFALTPKSQDLSNDPKYSQLIKNEIDYQVQDQQRQYMESTKSLSSALHSARDVILRVAGNVNK